MNSLRFSGSATVETCSARDRGAADHEEVDTGSTTTPRELRAVRCGDSDAGDR